MMQFNDKESKHTHNTSVALTVKDILNNHLALANLSLTLFQTQEPTRTGTSGMFSADAFASLPLQLKFGERAMNQMNYCWHLPFEMKTTVVTNHCRTPLAIWRGVQLQLQLQLLPLAQSIERTKTVEEIYKLVVDILTAFSSSSVSLTFLIGRSRKFLLELLDSSEKYCGPFVAIHLREVVVDRLISELNFCWKKKKINR